MLDHSHRAMLRQIYEGTFPPKLDGYEQTPLSAAILNAGLLHQLNSRFNWVFYESAVVHYPYIFREPYRSNPDLLALAVNTALANCHFLHFAMCRSLMRFLR